MTTTNVTPAEATCHIVTAGRSSAGQAGEPTAPEERPGHLRKRADLGYSPRFYGGERYWAVHDPVADQYFLLRHDEWTILQLLDGATDVDTVCQQYAARFAPRQLTTQACWAFLAQLYRDGLVESSKPGVGTHLLERNRALRRRRRLARWANPLFIRLPGINPTSHLKTLHGWTDWLFHPTVLTLLSAFVCVSLLWGVLHWDVFVVRSPGFYQLFAYHNVVLYAAVFVVIKFIHEIAHGLVCVHFGGRVRELGIRLMLGFPCFYCDVSHGWMIANRWHRIAISLAGIGVEAVIAAIACWVWWLTEPGAVNAVARSVMMVCSISTLFVNGNPLMRFDGYYVLADAVNVPNLWSRARGALARVASRLMTGINRSVMDGDPPAHNSWLIAYALATVVYQGIVLLAIAWFARGILGATRLDFVLPWFVGLLAASLVLGPAFYVVRALRHPGVWTGVSPGRVVVRCLALVLLALALLRIPLPQRVIGDAVLEPQQTQSIYVGQAGWLAMAAAPGQQVNAGDVVGRVENLALRREHEHAAGLVKQQEEIVGALEVQCMRHDAPEVRRRRAVERRQLAVYRQRLAELEERSRELTLVAPKSGVVFPPPLRAAEGDDDRLPPWSGSPLDPHNTHAWLPKGTLLCAIGATHRMDAVVHVDERQIHALAVGQPVTIYLQGIGSASLTGTVTEIAEQGLELRSETLADQTPGVRRWYRPQSLDRPVQRIHRVRVEIRTDTHPVLAGMQGRARIQGLPRSVWQRAVAYWRTTVGFAG